MAGKTKTMTQIRKILKGLQNRGSIRKIANRTGIARNTGRTYVRRVDVEERDIGALLALNDSELNQIVFLGSNADNIRHEELIGQFPYFEDELRKVDVLESSYGRNIGNRIPGLWLLAVL